MWALKLSMWTSYAVFVSAKGLMRQLPLVGSMLNWFSPIQSSVKGRTFNLASGTAHDVSITISPEAQLLSGRVSALWLGGCGFDPGAGVVQWYPSPPCSPLSVKGWMFVCSINQWFPSTTLLPAHRSADKFHVLWDVSGTWTFVLCVRSFPGLHRAHILHQGSGRQAVPAGHTHLLCKETARYEHTVHFIHFIDLFIWLATVHVKQRDCTEHRRL